MNQCVNLSVRSVHQWIKLNRLVLPDGPSQHACSITGIPGRPSFELLLNVEMIPLQSGLIAKRGSLHVRRQQISNSLCEVIEKALRDKLPKLVSTMADKHILLLERQHMILDPKVILGEIEDRRASFPDLAGVDEIWVLDNFGYGTNFWGTYLRFALHNGGKVVRSFVFEGGKLTMKFEDGEASYQ